MLEVEALGKRYGTKWIFRGLGFSIERGQALIVVGRNGSGKSTLLRTLVGLVRPTEGRVRLPDGDPRLVVGVSTLEMSLYQHLTVEEHLRFAGDLRGIPHRCEELLEQVDLTYAKDLNAAQLSTGMKSRLKMALAIQSKPTMLLLDEPGAALDPAGKEILSKICEDQLSRGFLILATNDPEERRFGTLELELAK